MRPITYLPHNYAKAGEIPGFCRSSFRRNRRPDIFEKQPPVNPVLFQRLAMRAIVNRPAQIGFLDDHTSAYRARIRICIFREHNLVPAGIAEKILFRIPATRCRHFRQRRFHCTEQRVQPTPAQRSHLPFRMDPCIEKNILQHAVSQAGNPLFRGEERFGGKIRLGSVTKRSK